MDVFGERPAGIVAHLDLNCAALAIKVIAEGFCLACRAHGCARAVLELTRYHQNAYSPTNIAVTASAARLKPVLVE
jgi:hypothetical protein